MNQLRQHENSNKFTEILADSWERFKSKYPSFNNRHVNKQVELTLRCADPQYGFKQYMCLSCGHESKLVAHSCKSKFCLRCGRVDGENFSRSIADKIFEEVDYRHLVLTIPAQFRKVFYQNRHHNDLFNVFYSAGWELVNRLLEKVFDRKVECGCLAVLHTVGRKCDFKPHLHILLMSGGIDSDGEWMVLDKFDYRILHKLWKEVLLEAMLDWDKKGCLSELCDYLDKRYWKGFVGHVSEQKAPKARRALLRYLGKYLCRPQISVSRIISYNPNKDEVVYRFKSHETGKSEVERVNTLTFVGRMVQQILPKGFKRVRYYGLQGIKNRSRLIAKVCSAVGRLNFVGDTIRAPVASARASYQEMVEILWGHDPFRCGRCGGRMELVRVWKPDKGFVFNLFKTLFGKDIGPCGILPDFLLHPAPS